MFRSALAWVPLSRPTPWPSRLGPSPGRGAGGVGGGAAAARERTPGGGGVLAPGGPAGGGPPRRDVCARADVGVDRVGAPHHAHAGGDAGAPGVGAAADVLGVADG